MTDDRAMLLRLAREAIDTSFRGADVTLPNVPWLDTPAAVFVTLRALADGALRGCVGSIEPRRPLGHAVVTAARAAAFDDERFAPLAHAELARVQLEISVLSPLALLPVSGEADARRHLQRTRPGVVLRCGRRQSVLLPKVWTSVPDATEFLRHLKLKAGLPSVFWSDAVELLVFTSDEFAEGQERPARAEAS